MPEPSHPPYATGATTIPRTLYRWLDINPQNGPLTRTQTFITLPTFNVPYTWLGYSDIVAAFNFEGPNNFSLTSLQNELPVAPNYLLCISWRTTSGIVHRYALWNQVGEVLFFSPPPLYTGQLIKKNFRLEVWSTSQGSPAINPLSINFYTSVAGQQDYRFGIDSSLVGADNISTNFSIHSIGGLGELLVSGAGTSELNGAYYLAGQYLGYNYYIMEGFPNINPSQPSSNPTIFTDGSTWWLTLTPFFAPALYYSSSDFVIPATTPDLVLSWSKGASASLPLPTVSPYGVFNLPFTWPVGSYSQPNPDTGTVYTLYGTSTLPTYLQPSSRVVVYYISTTQLVTYVGVSLPNPPNVNQPAYGYDPSGNLPSKGWNIQAQQWE